MNESTLSAGRGPPSRRAKRALVLAAICGTVAGGALAVEGRAHAPVPTAYGGASACRVEVRKVAEPAVVSLGGEIEVRLSADVRCDAADRLHTALVMDSSLEMGGARMSHVRESVAAFADAIGAQAPVALVSYSAVVDVLAPLTADRDALRAAAERLFPRRGSNLAGALAVARQVLQEGRVASGSPSLDAIVLLSGSAYDSEAAEVMKAAREARDEGILIAVVAYGGNADIPTLEKVASSPDRLYVEGLSSRLPSLYRAIAGDVAAARPTGAEVVDVLPPNMPYVWGSGVPAPRTRDRELTWTYAVWPDDGIEIAYGVQPRQVGRHATNERASVTVRFDRGAPLELAFPVPMVDVLAPSSPTASATLTRVAAASPTSTADALPTVPGTTTAPGRGVWLPAASRP